MERRYPLIDISVEVAERLLARLPGTPRPCTLQLLEGGHINTSYAVNLDDGQCVVLRIFAPGEAWFRKEVEVLCALVGSVPVPRLHLALFEPDVFEYPFIVLEWIEGTTLNAVLGARGEAGAEIGEAIAATLLKMRLHTLPAYPSTPFVEYMRWCLFERNGAKWLGNETASRLWAFVQEQSAFLDELYRDESLVHGDFQGDNILLREEAGRWQVAAVLDWEWAQNGCYLRDVGSLLRFEGEACTAFQRGLETGFFRHGVPLPGEWKKAAKVMDLAAQCEKLAHPTHRGEVTLRSIRIIERCLLDYAS